jgi:5-carboxymethyl-2-hydroxymuconate isomerase
MPHIVIEYSANLAQKASIPQLIEHLHETAIATGVFPRGGARTRAIRCDDYRIADGVPDNAFVHVCLRIGHGRSLEVRRVAAQAIFDALVETLASVYAQSPLGLSLEVQEIDPELSFKHNSLHDYVKARAAGASGASV